MLERRVGGQDRVVRLHDGVGHLGSRVDAELKLRLLAIVCGETLEKKGTEARTSATAEGVENEEALKTGAVVGQTPDLVHDDVDLLLSDGVVAASI